MVDPIAFSLEAAVTSSQMIDRGNAGAEQNVRRGKMVEWMEKVSDEQYGAK